MPKWHHCWGMTFKYVHWIEIWQHHVWGTNVITKAQLVKYAKLIMILDGGIMDDNGEKMPDLSSPPSALGSDWMCQFSILCRTRERKNTFSYDYDCQSVTEGVQTLTLQIKVISRCIVIMREAGSVVHNSACLRAWAATHKWHVRTILKSDLMGFKL